MEENKSNKYTLIIILLILISTLFFFRNEIKSLLKTRDITSTTELYNEPTVEDSKRSLENKADFTVSLPVSSSPDSIENLEGEVSTFAIRGAELQSINKESYENGKTGWVLVYLFEKDIVNTHKQLFSTANVEPFKFVYSARASNASLITTESDKYKVKIVSESINFNNTKTTINIESK